MSKKTNVKSESESRGYVTFDRSGVRVDIGRYFRSDRGQKAITALKQDQERLRSLMTKSASPA